MTGIRFSKIAGIIGVLCALVLASHAQTFNVLFSFQGGTAGASPLTAPLVQGVDGNFYGTTAEGGIVNSKFCAGGCGTIFKITTSGVLTTLYKFCSLANCADGYEPFSGLVLGTNGNFYGTTTFGGANGVNGQSFGTVFMMTPAGNLTTLHSFCSLTNCADGSIPQAGLVQGIDGNLYGTNNLGGDSWKGTAFKIIPTGEFTALHSFCTVPQCKDGFGPMGTLALATDGNLYGTTAGGGVAGGGTIFRLSPSGNVTPVYAFPNLSFNPLIANGVIQGSDGNLYGTKMEDPSDLGSVFQLTPTGQFTTLASLCTGGVCPAGAEPQSQLIQASDGNFYGTAAGFGEITGDDVGGVFEITSTGTLTPLYRFCPQQTTCPDGSTPYAGLLQATNGTFYGVTADGGTGCLGTGCGVVFTISAGLPAFVQSNPGFGRVGRVVGILGNNLTGTTAVTFNGIPATFKVISSTFIKAQVPTGATTGVIEVTTPSGTLNSNVPFHVLP